VKKQQKIIQNEDHNLLKQFEQTFGLEIFETFGSLFSV